MGKMSREKGKRFERQVAHAFQEYGYPARRAQQFAGKEGNHDVVGVPGLSIECKHVERLNIYDAVEQSIRDAQDGEMPTVIHRKNGKPMLVTMTFDSWIDLYREWEAGKYLEDEK